MGVLKKKCLSLFLSLLLLFSPPSLAAPQWKMSLGMILGIQMSSNFYNSPLNALHSSRDFIKNTHRSQHINPLFKHLSGPPSLCQKVQSPRQLRSHTICSQAVFAFSLNTDICPNVPYTCHIPRQVGVGWQGRTLVSSPITSPGTATSFPFQPDCAPYTDKPHTFQSHSSHPGLNIASYIESSPSLPLANNVSFLSEAITYSFFFFFTSYFSSPCTILTFHTCFSQKLETLEMKEKEKQTKFHEHRLYAGCYTWHFTYVTSPNPQKHLEKVGIVICILDMRKQMLQKGRQLSQSYPARQWWRLNGSMPSSSGSFCLPKPPCQTLGVSPLQAQFFIHRSLSKRLSDAITTHSQREIKISVIIHQRLSHPSGTEAEQTFSISQISASCETKLSLTVSEVPSFLMAPVRI